MTKIDKIGLITYAAIESIDCKDWDSQQWTFNSVMAENWYAHWLKHLKSAKQQWEDAEHNGDCIKQCCSCMACFYEEEIVKSAGAVSRALAVASVVGKTQQESLENAFWKLFHETNLPDEMPEYVTQWAEWVINKTKEENIIL